MKILLVCAGGMSTSILMKKMEKYAADSGFDLKISAKGIFEYEEIYTDYDVILLGPQISYKKNEISAKTGKPVLVVQPLDYSIGNAPTIFKQIRDIGIN